MSREIEANFGGAAIPSESPSGLRASVSIDDQLGEGGVDSGEIQTGYYSDLASDGHSISPTTQEVVLSSVPPGNSHEDTHYATDPGEPESEAESELAAAVLVLEGEMRSEIPVEFEWTGPDGDLLWTGDASLDDPSTEGHDYWTTAYFYTFVGRDFSQSAETEIVDVGTHTVTFRTNFGTWEADIEVVGPVTSKIGGVAVEESPGGDHIVDVTITNASGDRYAGEVNVTPDSDRRDVIGSAEFNIGPSDTDTVGVPVSGLENGTTADLCTWTYTG